MENTEAASKHIFENFKTSIHAAFPGKINHTDYSLFQAYGPQKRFKFRKNETENNPKSAFSFDLKQLDLVTHAKA